MPNVYRVSSTVKVEQMEAELSAQLSALRTEVEENGVPLGEAPSKSYSSVPLPKDISFFHAEREQALRRGLQVSEALPVMSPAQVIQTELDSCLNMEYTAESLPPLLHQFFADRSYQLAQLKHQLMLRWTRFCCHSGVIEMMYPHYKEQMSYMMNEYDDAVQRARRLAVSREKILTGQGNPINVVTQDDVVIYLKWLVCHLHSVKTIHNFLHVLHYIPSCDRKDKGKSSQQTFTKDHLNEPQHLNELVEDLPIHTVKLNNFRAELHSLVSYFHLPYDIVNLRTTGDEMELFSMVSKEFRTIFRKQELMKTFPQCDSTEVKDSQWGRKSPNMALKKEANWIPFIQVKPLKQDPWQKKLITKLTEHHSVDELLKMYCRFLQASDLLQVCEALRQHAADVCEMQGGRSPSVASHTSRPKEHKTSQIWASIYNVAAISEDTKMVGSSRTMRGLDNRGWKSKVTPVTTKSKSYMDSVQLLGLDGSPEEGTSDPVVTRGAYLSLIYLRHLKIRELQRVSLGMLNYLRSVERTLTIDLAGLCSRGEEPVVTADETGWMNAARGGSGLAGGLGSLHYSHNSPVDYKVQCSEFMEFPEVENLHDFYSAEGHFIHTQDQRGLYVVYDVALQDLESQENLLAIIASRFIQRNRKEQVGRFESSVPSAPDVHSLGRTDVDRVAVLLDLWTCETEFLESKVQLLNCYYEAYQHVSGCEERFAMAQVITDIMHRRPQLDPGHDHFVQAYRAEMACLQSHHNLIRAVLDCQIDQQRQYIQRIWRGDQTGSVNEYGLPPNYVPKHLVSLGGSSPALNNIFLLEVHPSLCLAASVYHTLAKAHTELCQLQGAVGPAEKVNLEHRLLQQALQNWSTLASPGASYSSQTQKDLFSDVFFDDPILVQGVGLSLIRSAEERDMRQGKEKQFHSVETLSKLLELVSIRHRLLESASETAHLSQLYRNLAIELGFDEFHLYLRPVQFELAVHKDKLEHGPVFITALLEDNSCVDRYIPSSLPLSIKELDESQVGRFSFNSEEAVVHLMSRPSIENLQVTLACQVAQKNALVSVVKQVCLCYWAETSAGPTEGQESIPSDNEAKSSTGFDSQTCRDNDSIKKKVESVPSKAAKSSAGNKDRLMEAFVSIQLEKVGLRDEMLNSFFKKKQAMGGLIKTPEEVAKIKRKLILEFCKKFSMHMSQYCVRAQIIAYCYSLTSLLHDIPIIRQSNFMIGQASEQKVCLDSEVDLCPDPRTFQRRLRRLLSADGKALINLWFIPHYSEVLRMFKTIDASASANGLHHTLEIMSSLHDIVYYLVSFARLGNTGEPFSSLSWRRRPEEAQPYLSADWGGTEGIGAELWDIQRQVDRLSHPGSPEAVSSLLQLRRQVLFLQFDNAVRHLIREAFLSSGDMVSYQSVSDNMVAALPLLSDSIRPTVYSSLLSVPQPLEPQSLRAQRMYPWRCFLACHGLHPVDICDIPPIEYCMQLCLSGLGDKGRMQANAAILGMSLLMEDVLGSGVEVEPVCLHDNKNDDFHHGRYDEEDKQCLEAENEETPVPDSMIPLRDPIQVQSALKGFLQLTKQLQVFKESWARTHLAVKRISTPSLYRQFLKLYRSEIFYPSMRALALKLGKECEYEALISRNESLLPPPGASEVDVKSWQLHRLLECTECDMIRTVQKRINRELTLVISERTRQDTGLPTELWIKAPLKHGLSPERPQVVEKFIHQLMENAEEVDGQVRVSEAHLRGCLTELGCSVMERERRSFLLYSQFYEQILQQQTQLLYQKEQDIKSLDSAQSHTPLNEVSALCRGMMLEMSALQARVTQLEEENNTLEEQLSLKFRQQYDAWVRQLLSTCIQLKARLDEYHLRMEQDVCQLVSKVRGEGVDRIIKLRKKYGSTQEDDSLSLSLMEKDDLHEFKTENSQLSSLLCKVKALGHWRQVLHQGKLHRQLLQSQQKEVICRREALRVKMMSEEEVVILQEELEATKQALDHCQTEYSRTRMLLSRKTEALHAARLQSAQEARSRQEMERRHGHSLEQMRGDMEDRERRLRELRQRLDRDGRGSQLQRQRSAKDIQQMKNQLHKERSLKQEAYQQVDKLQNQMNDHESTLSRCTSTPGLPRTSQQSGNQTRDSSLVDSGAKHSHLKATAWSRCDTKLERPKVHPSCLRAVTAETLLPELFK